MRSIISSELSYDVVLGSATVFASELTNNTMRQVPPHMEAAVNSLKTEQYRYHWGFELTLIACLPLSCDRLLRWVGESLGARSQKRK